jgi:hypothetical protein
MMWAAEWIVNALTAYVAFGVIFAIAFCAVGVSKIDVVAKDSGYGFRLVIFPGAAALWPALLTRWIRAETRRA